MELSHKLTLIAPEIVLFAGAVIVAILGLANTTAIRRSVPMVMALFLAASVVITQIVYANDAALAGSDLLFPKIGLYTKTLLGIAGIGLLALGSGSIDQSYETDIESGRRTFDPLRVVRGEYGAFFLLSIMGAMLVASATDLIWLFLALELTSLPTYVMVALSRSSRRAAESAIKYFFLGAMSAALFLYGFALLYGATGTLNLIEMRDAIQTLAASGEGLSATAILGMTLALLGIGFKIAAVPLHFYAPDVYEGAANHMTGFLAIVPKVAGMIALIVLCGVFGWSGHTVLVAEGARMAQEGLPQPVQAVLWMVAVLTMTLGNIGALLQTSIKRVIAYSGISHSGYMLIGIIAGTANGVDAVLFYLAAYSIGSLALFGVLAGLSRAGHEIESLDDLAGLWRKRPRMAGILALAAGSFLGLPPLLGFWAKLFLFIAGIQSGHIVLVVIAAVNSAISAWYYLHIAGVPVVRAMTPRSESITDTPSVLPRLLASIAGLAILIVPFAARDLYGFASSSLDGSELATPDAEQSVSE
jgi:NADH-quinone oxidoreductase subunit N